MSQLLCCPTKKKCHRTAEEAQPYLESLIIEDHPALAKRLGIYICRLCGNFHVGHNFGPIATRTQRRGKHSTRNKPLSLEYLLFFSLQELLNE